MGSSHSSSTTNNVSSSYEGYQKDNDQENQTQTRCGCNKKESFIYPNMTTSRSVWNNDFLDDGFFNRQSKGVHSIEAMKRVENNQKEQKTKSNESKNNENEKHVERFRGFAYKNNNPEPFERTFIQF